MKPLTREHRQGLENAQDAVPGSGWCCGDAKGMRVLGARLRNEGWGEGGSLGPTLLEICPVTPGSPA